MPRCCSFWGIQGTSQLPVTPGLAALLLGPWGPILATAGRNEPNLEPARFLSTAGARRQRTADKSCPRDEPRDSRRHCRGCEASKRQLENHTRPKLGWGRQICSWAARGGGGLAAVHPWVLSPHHPPHGRAVPELNITPPKTISPKLPVSYSIYSNIFKVPIYCKHAASVHQQPKFRLVLRVKR